MNALHYLFAGCAVFWAGLFIYLLVLQARLRSLHREIELLEERLAEAEPAASADAAAASTAQAAAPAPEHTSAGA